MFRNSDRDEREVTMDSLNQARIAKGLEAHHRPDPPQLGRFVPLDPALPRAADQAGPGPARDCAADQRASRMG